MTDAPDALEQLLQQSSQLYTLPGVAVRVLDLTNHPLQVDAAQLKACIEQDPALTTKVLRVVNSSLFGLSRRVSDLSQALGLLGAKPLKLLVLGFSLPDPLFADIAGDMLNRYWKHTLTRAVAAREISERIWRLPGDDVFIAALLKDLGRLVLIQGLGRPYVDFLRKADDGSGPLRAAERRAIGFDHVQLTAGVLKQWGLPESLIEAVSTPDTFEEVEALPPSAQATPQILYLAELLAQLLAEEQTEVLPEVLAVGERFHKLTESQLSALAAGLAETVGQLAEVLSLELPGGLVYSEVLARAYQQLSQAAADAAGELAAARGEALAARLDRLMHSDEARTLTATASGFTATRRDAGQIPAPPRAELAVAAVAAPADNRAPGAVQRPAAAQAAKAIAAKPAKAAAGPEAAHASADIDPGLLGRLAAAATACRRERCDLSLLLIEFDRYDELLLAQGVAGAGEIWRRLEAACRGLDHPGAQWLQLGDARLALVLPDCDRRGAVELGNELLRQMRDDAHGADGFAATISVAICTVAVPPRNFLPRGLVERAESCLYAAQVAGGNCLKSIEIYN
ncbi:MAG TPA: HDOD domain-containing protein [Pirellulales bacterium]|nr:HDOD domain-containing protein [Pirellulales bacterium]